VKHGNCSISECKETTIVARGWCNTHYCRWKRTGDAESSTPTCSVEGCGKLLLLSRNVSSQMCAPHLNKFIKFGNPNWQRPRSGETPCGISGCLTPAVARGWCSRHWSRWKRTGDPVRPHPRKDLAVDYGDGTRQCRICFERLPIEQFDKDKSASGGHRSQCKLCRGKKISDWYYRNQDERKSQARKRRKNNPDAVRKSDFDRYRRDRPKRVELAKEASHRRRARLANAKRFDKGITVTALRKRDGDHCHFCQKTMLFRTGKHGVYKPRRASIEHLVPLNVGGLHVWENVALTCLSCNLRRPKNGDAFQLLLIS